VRHAVQQGQREGRRLAGAGGGVAQQVASRDQVRDGLQLDGRGLLVAEFGQGGEELVTQPEVAEG
jgi:hypothetical protein